MLKKQTVLFFALFLLSCQAFSLTWVDAILLAQKNNNELKSAQKSLESYEWNYCKAFTSLLPQLSASAGMTENLSSTSSATSKSYSYGLSASQTIFYNVRYFVFYFCCNCWPGFWPLASLACGQTLAH